MIITYLATHPIKSLLPISVPSLTLTPLGPLYDRRFLLLRPAPAGVNTKDEVLLVGRYSQLCLFAQSFYPSDAIPEEAEAILVEYKPPENAHNEKAKDDVSRSLERRSLLVPLHPPCEGLSPRKIDLHHSTCTAYDMGDSPYAVFFSECLGFPVRLIYLGESRRKVLGNVAPTRSISVTPMSNWRKKINMALYGNPKENDQYEITFADCAPFLVTTVPSLADVSKRLVNPKISEKGERLEMDMSKFRPNIVLGPPHEDPMEFPAWDEDFWAELTVKPKESTAEEMTMVLTANCGRCRSINVDFETGKYGEEPLKHLMKDRRVDKGAKYKPIFGRYGFLENKSNHKVSVGDRVFVSKRNEERTVFEWPGL